MAIVKMKRLRMAAMQSDREELLHLLQRMGCVEIDEPSVDWTDPDWAGLKRPDGEELSAARDRKSAGEQALATLKRYAPVKTGLLTPRPTVSEEQMFEAGACAQARQAVDSINDTQRHITTLQAQQAKLQGQKLALAPWLPLDVPLETKSTKEVAIHFGTLPAGADLSAVREELLAVSDLIELTQASSDKDLHYLLLVCHASQEEAALEVLKERGWSRSNLRDYTGTAAENDKRIDGELADIARQLEADQQALSQQGGLTQAVKQDIDRAAVDIDRAENKSRLVDTDAAFYLDGWVPAEDLPALEQALAKFDCAWETADPTPEEYPQVPVKLKNNSFTRPLNMVTDMYALPAYGSLDPNPLMAPFFVLFYGMMMADMGYGILMFLAGLIVVKKAKPSGPTMRHMFPLLCWCGISTFIWGAVTGGFFGDFIPQLLSIINPASTFEMPALFSPLDDALAVLIGSLVLGVVQIFTGMGISMYKQIKRGEVMAALCNEGAWYLVFLLAGLGIALGQVKIGLIAALVVIVVTQSYGKKGIVGKLMGIGGSLYNNITGYFSDILSYSRLMALMLAGAVIAQVFNTLGAITGNVVMFILISMVGNALNFALNLLGCFVHDMRLQCLEYFGRFYEDGGKPFRPLDINTQYVEVNK